MHGIAVEGPFAESAAVPAGEHVVVAAGAQVVVSALEPGGSSCRPYMFGRVSIWRDRRVVHVLGPEEWAVMNWSDQDAGDGGMIALQTRPESRVGSKARLVVMVSVYAHELMKFKQQPFYAYGIPSKPLFGSWDRCWLRAVE